MARRLIWSPRSLADLDEIAAYIGTDAPLYARKVVSRFEVRARGLPDMPGQGRRVPEYEGPEEIREVFVHRWRMIYRVRGEAVAIVTLVHGARPMATVCIWLQASQRLSFAIVRPTLNYARFPDGVGDLKCELS